VPFDPVPVDEFDEVPLAVPRQCGFYEMRVLADEVRGRGTNICEITTPTARNADLLTCRFGVINNQCARAAMGRAV